MRNVLIVMTGLLTALSAQATQDRDPADLSLERSGDGRFRIEAAIDQTPHTLLLATGRAVTATERGGVQDIWAGGRHVQLETDLTGDGAAALGMDFFLAHDTRFIELNFAVNAVRTHIAETLPHPLVAADWMAMEAGLARSGLIASEGLANETPVLAVIHTGMTGLAVNRSFADQLIDDGAIRVTDKGEEAVRLRRAELGGAIWFNTPARIIEDEAIAAYSGSGPAVLLVGADMLDELVIVADFEAARIAINPPDRFTPAG